MKLWVFLFTDPAHRLQSARVAAPDKSWARGLLGAEEDLSGPGVLCHWGGEVDAPLGVIENVARHSKESPRRLSREADQREHGEGIIFPPCPPCLRGESFPGAER